MRSIRGAIYLVKHLKKSKKKSIFQCYEDRNNKLSDMGVSYYQYLESDEWKRIREQVLESFPYCSLCRKRAFQVHHTDYDWDTLLGICTEGLVSLCNKCHEGIEFDGNRKRTLEEANRVLLLVMKNSPTPEIKILHARLQKREQDRPVKLKMLERKQKATERKNRKLRNQKS